MSFFSDSSRARFSFVRASSSDTRRRSRSASARIRLALRLFDLRLKQGRIQPREHLPLRTSELKSALSSWMVPDTCVPTCTVVTAWSAPVAPDRLGDVAARDPRGGDRRRPRRSACSGSSRSRRRR